VKSVLVRKTPNFVGNRIARVGKPGCFDVLDIRAGVVNQNPPRGIRHGLGNARYDKIWASLCITPKS